MRAFSRVEQCRDEASLGAWLTRIAVREAIARVRRERRRRELAGEGLAAGASDGSPERHAYGAELRSAIEVAIDALPLRLRLAFMLRAVEALSTRRTAGLLRISPEAVKVRVFRARAALRRALGDDVFTFGGARCDAIVAACCGASRAAEGAHASPHHHGGGSRSITPASSLSSLAATIAVMLERSQRGLYSTMSAPTMG